MTELNAAGFALLTQLEACRLAAYRDPGGMWTIGYGHTGPDVLPGLCWSQAQADQALQRDSIAVAAGVTRLVTQSLNGNQSAALVCLAFNIGLGAFGASSALRAVNAGQWGKIPDCIARWNKLTCNGVLEISPGLVGRRAAEIALWQLDPAAPIPDFAALRDAAARAA